MAGEASRPARKKIPLNVRLKACLLALGLDPADVQWDHNPALGLRPVNAAGDDYDPPQLDPRYIVPMATASHALKTDGPAHDKSNADKARIAKVKRIERTRLMIAGIEFPVAPKKRKIPSRPFPKRRKADTKGA